MAGLAIDWNGSSPRLRGTLLLDAASSAGRSVHPRACGEHIWSLHRATHWRGSSPRLRGTRCIARALQSVRYRFIPAPAGNTPRSSGGKGRFTRFIPAPAGNTVARIAWVLCTAVHPRACGEHAICAYQRLQCGRFIPAPAGNTASCTWRALIQSVHPRACGEHRKLRCHTRSIGGSSPRLRGTRHNAACANLTAVGSSPRLRGTRSEAGDCAVMAVHPRACGEHAD